MNTTSKYILELKAKIIYNKRIIWNNINEKKYKYQICVL